MVFLPPHIQCLLFFHFNELKMISNDLDGCLPSLSIRKSYLLLQKGEMLIMIQMLFQLALSLNYDQKVLSNNVTKSKDILLIIAL